MCFPPPLSQRKRIGGSNILSVEDIKVREPKGGRHSTEVAFALLPPPTRVRFSARAFPRKILDVAARFIDS